MLFQTKREELVEFAQEVIKFTVPLIFIVHLHQIPLTVFMPVVQWSQLIIWRNWLENSSYCLKRIRTFPWINLAKSVLDVFPWQNVFLNNTCNSQKSDSSLLFFMHLSKACRFVSSVMQQQSISLLLTSILSCKSCFGLWPLQCNYMNQGHLDKMLRQIVINIKSL